MAWQLVVLWALVGGAVSGFIWHERKVKSATLADKALRFATEPKYRYEAPLPDPGLVRVMAASMQPNPKLVSRFVEELRRA